MKTFPKQTWCVVMIFALFIALGIPAVAEEYSGVGLALQPFKKALWVHPETGVMLKPPMYDYFVSPLPSSPAKRAGMPELAKLITVDGYDVDHMDPAAVVGRIQGPAGSTVIIRVIVEEERDGILGRYIREYTLIREHIISPNK